MSPGKTLKIIAGIFIGYLLLGFIACQCMRHRDGGVRQQYIDFENASSATDRQRHPEEWYLETTGYSKGIWVRKSDEHTTSTNTHRNYSYPGARTMTPEEIREAADTIREIHREQGYH